MIEECSAQRLVEVDRRLIPVQHFPSHAVTILAPRNPCHLCEQRLADSLSAKCPPHQQIFQEQPRTPFPSGVKTKKQVVYRRLPVPFCDHCAKLPLLPETESHHITLG